MDPLSPMFNFEAFCLKARSEQTPEAVQAFKNYILAQLLMPAGIATTPAKRAADEPLIDSHDAAYLDEWFSKESA